MTTTTSSTSTASNAAAAAAAAAARAAEAARRAAEAARKQAEAARAQAAKAQKAQQAAMEQRKVVQSTQSRLDRGGLTGSKRQQVSAQLQQQKSQWKASRQTAIEQTQKAQTMLKAAEATAVKGQGAVTRANAAAVKAGQPSPFACTDGFSGVNGTNRGTFDKLFGRAAAPAQRAIGGLGEIDREATKAQNANAASRALADYRQLDAADPSCMTAQQLADFNNRLAGLAQQNPDPVYQRSLMTLAAPQLQRSGEVLAQAASDDVKGEETEALAGSLSALGNALPQKTAAQLAYGLTASFPNHRGLGQVDDGFGHFVDNGGDPRFQQLFVGALKARGLGDAADEMVEGDPGLIDSIGNRLGDVGDIASGVFDTMKDAAGDAFNFLGDQLNALGDAVRHEAANLIDVDGRLGDLKAPGDSFTAHLDVEANVLGADGSAGVEMKVTKTADGYTMDLTGKGSLGVAEKLGIGGLGEAGLGASATASGTVSFDFADASQVTEGAETVAGIGIGSALGGPLGSAITGGSAGDELGRLAGHFASAQVMLGVEGDAGAQLGNKLGLDVGVGGSVAGQVGVEIDRDQNVSLLLDQKVSVTGSISGELPGVSLPAGAGGTGEVELQTRVPLDVDLGQLTSDVPGAISKLSSSAIDGATTTLSGKLQFGAGSGGGSENVEVDLSASGKTRDLVGAVGKAFSGDLGGAIGQLGKKVTVAGSVRQYDEASVELDAGVNVPVLGGVDISGGVDSTSANSYRAYSGQASRLPQLLGQIAA